MSALARVSRALQWRWDAVRARAGGRSSPRSPGGAASGGDRVQLLVGSTLFDDAWYSFCAGRSMSRREAAEHYLETGRREGLTPHPLFLPAWCASQLAIGEVRDPLVVYLRRRRFEIPTHPLFDTGGYLADHPDALEHPAGPVGHYQDSGALAGARANDWYRPDPDAQPGGLVDWLWDDARRWQQRQAPAMPSWSRTPQTPSSGQPAPSSAGSRGRTTSVLLVAERSAELVGSSVESVLAQTSGDWELLVARLATGPDLGPLDLPQDPRIRLLEGTHGNRWAALNHGLAEASGRDVAWMVEGDTWAPDRLHSVQQELSRSGRSWLHDCAANPRPDGERAHYARRITAARLEAGAEIEPGTVVVEREVAHELGGFDESLRGGQLLDFMLRLTDRDDGAFLEQVGVTTSGHKNRLQPVRTAADRPFVDYDRLPAADDVVLNGRLVDWTALSSRAVSTDVVSVLVPTHHDWEMTELAVRRVVEHRDARVRVEVVVVDNGCPVVTSGVLSSLPERYDDVTLVRSPVNRGFALGNNLGLAAANGATVVFLNNDTEVQAGWLGPLLDALEDPDVLGAQSLLLYPTGSVQSAGVVFPRGGGIPHVLLQGFPTEDAAGLEHERLHALTGAALAMRHSDVVALRGFDPVFRNGMEDVDICLRLAERRAGRFVVRPDSRVVHHESRSPGRFSQALVNRQVLLDRWAGRLPEDDVTAWGRPGLRGDRPRDPERGVAGSARVRAAAGAQPHPGGPRGAALAALGDQDPGSLRAHHRDVGRHPLRTSPGRCPAALARRSSSTTAGSSSGVRARMTRWSYSSRAGAVHPAARPGEPALDDQPPGAGDAPSRWASTACTSPASRTRSTSPSCGAARWCRSSRPPTPAASIPTGPSPTRVTGCSSWATAASSNGRSWRPPPRPTCRSACSGTPGKGSSTRSSSAAATSPTRSSALPTGGRLRAERPLARHGCARVPVEPALRRRRLRCPGDHG